MELLSRTELDELVTQWRAAKAERLELDKMVAAAKKLEDQLKEIITEQLDAQAIEGIVTGGRITAVTKKQVPVCNDQAALSSYILEHGALDLLQFRLSTKAAELRLADGIDLPGVALFDKLELSDKKA